MAIRQYGESKRDTKKLISFDRNEVHEIAQAARIRGMPFAVYVRTMAVDAAATDVVREQKRKRKEAP